MGRYVDNDDLYDVWGERNIITWSDLDGGRTLDQDRVDAAISWAEAYVENRFRRTRYAIPFTIGSAGDYDYQLKNWVASFAGDKLYKARSARRGAEEESRTSAVIKEVQKEMAQVLGGQLEIDAGKVRTPTPTAPFVVR